MLSKTEELSIGGNGSIRVPPVWQCLALGPKRSRSAATGKTRSHLAAPSMRHAATHTTIITLRYKCQFQPSVALSQFAFSLPPLPSKNPLPILSPVLSASSTSRKCTLPPTNPRTPHSPVPPRETRGLPCATPPAFSSRIIPSSPRATEGGRTASIGNATPPSCAPDDLSPWGTGIHNRADWAVCLGSKGRDSRL